MLATMPLLLDGKNTMRKWLLLALLLGGFAHADELGRTNPSLGRTNTGESESWLDIFGNSVKPTPAEQAFTFPDIQDLKSWAPIKFRQEIKTNQYHLALDSLTLGEDDILRYVVAVVPKQGNAKNIIFEGIDCNTHQYRTYGWGNPDGSWLKSSTVTWKKVSQNQHNAWQGALDDKFCQFADRPDSVEAIRKNFTIDRGPTDCSGCRAN